MTGNKTFTGFTESADEINEIFTCSADPPGGCLENLVQIN